MIDPQQEVSMRKRTTRLWVALSVGPFAFVATAAEAFAKVRMHAR